MATLIEQLLTKLGLRDEPKVIKKTYELVRLLELRSTTVSVAINEYAKVVLCADIAASLVAIPIDKEQALKLSGLRKSHYASKKRMLEKLLDLSKIVGVNDICIQLSINQVNKKADELLNLYRKVITSEQSSDVDISHPQYAAMAVYMACKLSKQKVSKSKLVLFSNLKSSQWLQLEQKWEKFITKHYKDTMNTKSKLQNIESHATVPSNEDISQKNGTDIEDYEQWKKRMLDMAQAKLEEQKSAKNMDDGLNLDFNDAIDMILGC